jgi:DNA-binding transcriptional regulator WhiA
MCFSLFNDYKLSFFIIVSTSISSTKLTTEIQSILTSTKILVETTMINPTTSLQSIDTSEVSSIVDQIQTSKSSIISSTIQQSNTPSTTTLPSSFIISAMLSTGNYEQTSQNTNIMSTKLQSTSSRVYFYFIFI